MRRWYVVTSFGLSDPYPTATEAHAAADDLGFPVVARDDEDEQPREAAEEQGR